MAVASAAELLLEAGPDLEAGVTPQGSEGETVPEEQPQRMPVYRDIVCCLPRSKMYHWWQQHNLPSTPGYAWSMLSRRRLRALTTLAIFVASLLAEGMSQGFDEKLAFNNVIFGLLLCFAGCAPGFMESSNLPNVALGVAASEHTWRAAWRVIGTADEGTSAWERRDALCSEHLAMFWVIVLVTLCSGDVYALGAYGSALVVLQQTTGVPGVPCFLVAACMLVPVYLAERVWCSAYAEVFRNQVAIRKLLNSTGGAWLTVDIEAGHILEMSPALTAFVGPSQKNCGIADLVRLHKDKETLDHLVLGCSIAASAETAARRKGVRWAEYTTLLEENVEAALAPRTVDSLRCARCPKGVRARLVPYNLSAKDRRLCIWVETDSPEPTDPRVELAMREQAVAETESSSSLKLQSVETRERRVEDLERALEQMHQLYLKALAEQEHFEKALERQQALKDEEKMTAEV
ncbi:ANK1 [Symbiodinium natans]|uniref:ANK1 protein n=1 Tax=Symbiodinium natans TaxID=878477 RepID=A0A812NA82_9DINO|nr:ANK1 [Symbiodinium natans]